MRVKSLISRSLLRGLLWALLLLAVAALAVQGWQLLRACAALSAEALRVSGFVWGALAFKGLLVLANAALVLALRAALRRVSGSAPPLRLAR